MTAEHIRRLREQSPPEAIDRIDLLMRFSDDHGPIEVPDPWHGGEKDFIKAFDMIESGVDGLLQHWPPTRF